MAKKYREMKVYDVLCGGQYDHSAEVDVFTNRGYAEDMVPHICWRFGDGTRVADARILYTGEKPSGGQQLFRCLNPDHSKHTAWYRSMDEAVDASKAMRFEGVDYQRGMLDVSEVEALPQKFQVTFQRDDRGRLFTRVETHPEINGTRRKGKVFFPDRAFVGADIGTALVSVSKEFDSYGFLTGEMESFALPTLGLKDVLDWAWENDKGNAELLIINHPGRGRYYAIQEKLESGAATQVRKQICRLVESDFNAVPHVIEHCCLEDEVKQDAENYLERCCTFGQMWIEDAWGQGPELDYDSVAAMFRESDCFSKTMRYWTWNASEKFLGEFIDRAVQDGVISVYQHPLFHVAVLTFNEQNFLRLLYYSFEDVKKLAAEMSRINAETDEIMAQKRRKGVVMY